MLANLIDIQTSLKCNKSQFNSYGGFSYRSAEDILTAVKPLLASFGCLLTLTDDIVLVGDRVYVKSTATITDPDGNTQSTTAFAREPDSKKGMDASQVTGCASSYARKYALNALFLIDDVKDADTDEYRRQTEDTAKKPKVPTAKTANNKITPEQQRQLADACKNAGPNLSLEKALEACRVDRIENITVTQFTCLMNRLNKSVA